MKPSTLGPASLDDLARVEGKAELIAGRIVRFMASGFRPARAAFQIAMRLELYSLGGAPGVAFADGIGYALDPPLTNGRQSFSPDASYYVGPSPPNDMRIIEGTPDLAVEVRSENDYGPSAEAEMETKRADYFEAGTLVVWDVDPMARTIAVYRGDPVTPAVVYRLGDQAEAEPAVPGWRPTVGDLFA